jgi:hypothetical protein
MDRTMHPQLDSPAAKDGRGKGGRSHRGRQPNAWLGVGAVGLFLGAALVGGAGVAHADSGRADSSVSGAADSSGSAGRDGDASGRRAARVPSRPAGRVSGVGPAAMGDWYLPESASQPVFRPPRDPGLWLDQRSPDPEASPEARPPRQIDRPSLPWRQHGAGYDLVAGPKFCEKNCGDRELIRRLQFQLRQAGLNDPDRPWLLSLLSIEDMQLILIDAGITPWTPPV